MKDSNFSRFLKLTHKIILELKNNYDTFFAYNSIFLLLLLD